MQKLNPAFWRNRPTFVTGATGLLGSWLTEHLLRAGAAVTCLARKPVTHDWRDRVRVIQGDLSNRNLLQTTLETHGITTVMHVAAQAIVSTAKQDPLTTFESNIAGTWNVLEACRRSQTVKHIVVASSDKAYGEQTILPYTEDMPLLAKHPYEVSKAATDLLAQTYAATYGLPVAITRCGNFYGGGDLNWNRIIPGTIRSIWRGERPVIRSDGQFIRDYFYVEDGAAAYMLLAEQLDARPELRGEAFNFSNEIKLSVRDIVSLILRAMQSDLVPDIRNEPSNEIRQQYLSAEKARCLLGWRPMFDLEEGLQKTVAWYRAYFRTTP